MPRLRGWTVNLRVGGQELPEMITQVEGTTAICGVSCLPEQNVEITVSKPDNDLAYILLVEVDNVLRVLPLEDTLLDISRGWNCSADIFRPYRWLGLEHFDVKPPKTKYNGFVGVTRVRLYPANSTYSINIDAFFERPTKSGHLPLLKRLTHYVGMGGFEKLTHSTQPIVGTVDNFHPSTAGDLDVEFRFEYFHNILKPLASEGGRFKRKQSDSLSVETESVEDAEAGEKGLMSVPSKKPSASQFNQKLSRGKRARIDNSQTYSSSSASKNEVKLNSRIIPAKDTLGPQNCTLLPYRTVYCDNHAPLSKHRGVN